MTCFKAYDIRGRLGEEINEDVAYRIGRAFGEFLGAKRVAIGCDVRLSSPLLKAAVASGLMDSGADVIDLGMTGTEEVYFAAFHLDVDGAIEVTASHNPLDYNGMKLVGRGAKPISNDSGLRQIREIAETGQFALPAARGKLTEKSILAPYVEHLLGYIDAKAIRPLTIVANSGNGAAGHVIDALEARFREMSVPITFIKVHHEPDGNFPHGIPNPIMVDKRADTINAVIEHKADLGLAWDGDFDRCFLFDETGAFIEGYYIVGLLAEAFLSQHAGERVIHDPRLIWNTQSIAQKYDGLAIQSKTGHAFIKERMRAENAVYGGEMSAHHYFRDFAYCDSGMIPWMLVVGLMSKQDLPLSALVNERIAAFPCSGEINYRVRDAGSVVAEVASAFEKDAIGIDKTDGLSLSFKHWRFNIRSSNTEPLLRLNVEALDSVGVVHQQVATLESLLKNIDPTIVRI